MTICIKCNRDHYKNINNSCYDESNKCLKCGGFICEIDEEHRECYCCGVIE